MSTRAQTFTLQLTSSSADHVGQGHYSKTLVPPIKVPYLARPFAALEGIAFSNSFTNVDAALYDNNKVVLQWNKSQADAIQKVTPYEETLIIPDGHYTVEGLELEIAKQAFKTASTTYIDGWQAKHPGQLSLWRFMGSMLGAHNGPVHERITDDDDDDGVEGAQSGQNKVTTVVALPGKFVHYLVQCSSVPGAIPTGTKIQSIYAKEITLSNNLTATIPTNTVIEIVSESEWGYGYGTLQDGLAEPVLSVHSHWGEYDVPGAASHTEAALTFGEVEALGRAAFYDTPIGGAQSFQPDKVVPPILVPQEDNDKAYKSIPVGQRYLKPFYLHHDSSTNEMQCLVAAPQVRISNKSTLFTKLLGYDGSLTEDNFQLLQSPWSNAGKPFTAQAAAKLDMVRSLELHVPTLIGNSYNQDGRMQGAQLASVPVTVPQNDTQVWEAKFDNRLPLDLHGADITAIEWYLTNQDGQRVNLQGNNFQITLRIGWPDPLMPPLGSAGAEDRLEDVRTVFRDRVQYGK